MIIGYKKENGQIVRYCSDEEKNDSLIAVDVLYCGICGTDYQKYIGMDNVLEWGHEIIGKVNDEIVTIRTTYPCGKCSNCLNGHSEKCTNWSRINFNGFANQIFVNEKSIINIPDELDLVYSLVEPLYVAKSLINHVNPNKDSIYTIIGNGTIGLLSAFLIRKKYQGEVRIVGKRNPQSRKNFTNLIGAEFFDTDHLEEALSASDKVIITSPYNTIPNILKYVNSYTNITFNGISKETNVSIEMDKWHFKNLNIWPSFPHPQSDFSEEIRIIHDNKDVLKNIITNIYNLDKIEEAFKLLNDKSQDTIKILVKCKEDLK